jgi:hypothetical protein
MRTPCQQAPRHDVIRAHNRIAPSLMGGVCHHTVYIARTFTPNIIIPYNPQPAMYSHSLFSPMSSLTNSSSLSTLDRRIRQTGSCPSLLPDTISDLFSFTPHPTSPPAPKEITIRRFLPTEDPLPNGDTWMVVGDMPWRMPGPAQRCWVDGYGLVTVTEGRRCASGWDVYVGRPYGAECEVLLLLARPSGFRTWMGRFGVVKRRVLALFPGRS